MHHDARAYLWDIQKAAEAIKEFIAGMDLRAYSRNEVVHAAVERKFGIIGEALVKLSKADPELASRIPNVRAIIAFRNILIHGYAVVEHQRVWQIANDFLPGLHAVVTALLVKLGPPDA
jgi:uncharacterized protein with HEPN domain